KFLITRGLWLIFLEFSVVRLAAFFNVEPKFFMMMQVIWVIGLSMVLMAALIHLPLKVLAGLGLVMIALHNLLDGIRLRGFFFPNATILQKIWVILHQQGIFPIDGQNSPVVLMLYPLIPWVGVMAVGYAFGSIYQKSPAARKQLLLKIGLIAVGLFVVIRGINIYGDPQPWQWQVRGIVYTGLSF